MPCHGWWCIQVLLLLCTTCFAQERTGTPDPHNIDASGFGQRVDLTPVWLFSATDDPKYASPNFDDRSWTQVYPREALLTSYGFRNFPIGWYRVHVHLPRNVSNVVLSTRRLRGEYQIFANGLQIGGPATIRQDFDRMQNGIVDFPIPGGALSAAPGELVVAFRFAPCLYGTSGPGTDTPMGPSAGVYLVSAEAAAREASYVATHTVGKYIFEAGLYFLVALVAVSLFLAIPGNREYLAAAVYLLTTAAAEALTATENLGVSSLSLQLPHEILVGISFVSLCEFVRLVLHLPRSRVLQLAEAAIFLGTATFILSYSFLPIFGIIALSVPRLVVDVLLPVLLVRGWRERNPDAPLLLSILLVYLANDYWDGLALVTFLNPHLGTMPALPAFGFGTYTLHLDELSTIFCPCMILLFLALRTVRIARDRTRIAAEVEAAQSVQHLLMARSSVPTPGFKVDAVYRPASELGGDLFLLSPGREDGSLLAIVGDVSGKGMKAAMRVSMILGVLRRETSRSPGEILTNLNQVLLTQTEMGFTTACCVHVNLDGRYLIANAGHIAPYINGVEAASLPALPLGLAPDQTYESVSGVLQPGERLVLLSDGVPEARSTKGELYGFDRLSALTMESATRIADTAQTFGQDDDITVLTISMAASEPLRLDEPGPCADALPV